MTSEINNNQSTPQTFSEWLRSQPEDGVTSARPAAQGPAASEARTLSQEWERYKAMGASQENIKPAPEQEMSAPEKPKV